MFLVRELIKQKRDGGRLEKNEIDWLITEYSKDQIVFQLERYNNVILTVFKIKGVKEATN